MIINSVCLNTGDALLLKTVQQILNECIGEYQLIVACENPELCQKLYPEFAFIADLEKSLENSKNTFLRYISVALNKFGLMKWLVQYCPLRFFPSYYLAVDSADYILLSPGGYFHNYYDYKTRLVVIDKILNLNKKVILLNQSFGVLQEKDISTSILSKAEKIFVRESLSFKILNQQLNNVLCVSDLAFNFSKSIEKKRSWATPKKVMVNFRTWKKDSDTIVKKAAALVNHLIDKYKVEVTFLSTCQGLQAYHDDTQLYERMMALIDSPQFFLLKKGNHSPDEYMKILSEYDAYIGMRLHGAIMAMLCHVPAFIIGYESKSKGIFNDLDISDYEILYTENEQVWLAKTDFFLTTLQQTLDLQHKAILKARALNEPLYHYLKSIS